MSRTIGKDGSVLEKIVSLERALYSLKIDFLKTRALNKKAAGRKSLFGSVSGGDITDEIIEDSKKSLFRDLGDV
jgi:ribosomal protein L9